MVGTAPSFGAIHPTASGELTSPYLTRFLVRSLACLHVVLFCFALCCLRGLAIVRVRYICVLTAFRSRQADMRSFHPRLKVDVGRGPGKGLGPRLFVGLASAAPLPLTASQASKLGIFDSFDVDLNPAQVRSSSVKLYYTRRRQQRVGSAVGGPLLQCLLCAGIFISRHLDFVGRRSVRKAGRLAFLVATCVRSGQAYGR